MTRKPVVDMGIPKLKHANNNQKGKKYKTIMDPKNLKGNIDL